MNSIDFHFQEVLPQEITDNFIKLIGNDWMLITAGTEEKFNTMTASWGAAGVLWNKPVAICFIRPTRYTYDFANQADIFTLSFFYETERSILNFCGSKSGKDVDKIKETGLLPVITNNEGISFKQARLCMECRKIYFDDLKPDHFLLPDTDKKNYSDNDYHRMFIGEIITCYTKK